MKQSNTSKPLGTDFKRLEALKDDDIDFSDIPELTPERLAGGVVRRGLKPLTKCRLMLQLDSDVIEWFRAQENYQAKINALLRAYMNERTEATTDADHVPG